MDFPSRSRDLQGRQACFERFFNGISVMVVNQMDWVALLYQSPI
jgi:hypothetical protein